MHRCLELARQSQGKTGINPLVGAVLVRDGKIVAEAFHSGFGKPHAERQLLENFEQKISTRDILYVNLEPCCHTDKKTPPCVPLILERGVKRLVFGMIDPNPMVAGKGISALRKAGVDVIGPVLPEECRRLNRGFISLMTRGRPWITLHRAQTRDGRVANTGGLPLKITSHEQDIWVHRFLRARHDAILVGVGTILTDNPQLNVRYMADPPEIFRIVLDVGLRIPLDSRVMDSPLAERTILITKPGIDPGKIAKLRKLKVSVFEVPCENGIFDWKSLWKVLTTPNKEFHGLTSILVEGGIRTWELFRSAKLVDEEVILIGEK